MTRRVRLFVAIPLGVFVLTLGWLMVRRWLGWQFPRNVAVGELAYPYGVNTKFRISRRETKMDCKWAKNSDLGRPINGHAFRCSICRVCSID
jgi:hypothetical protein